MVLNDTITNEDIFLLKSINMDYVNLDKSFVNFEGMVYFNLNIDKLPSMKGKPAREIFKDRVFKAIYGDCEPDDTVEYYINYNPTPYTDISNSPHGKLYSSIPGSIPHGDLPYLTFSAEFIDKEHLNKNYGIQTADVRIGDKNLHSEVQEALREFSTKATEWVCQYIRETLFADKRPGIFHKDEIKNDTYIHQRSIRHGTKYINYVLYGWWRYIDKIKEPIWFKLPDIITPECSDCKSNTYLAIDIEV